MAASTSPAPPSQTLTVSASGSTPLGFNANAFPTWIHLNGVATPPSIQGSTSVAPVITVTIDPSAYSAGNAQQSGTIQINGPNSVTVPVTVSITSSCTTSTALTATPSSVTLTPTTSSQQVTIAGPTIAQISATVLYGTGNPVGWFGVNTTSLISGQGVTVSLLSSTGLSSGASGSVVFTQNGTSNSVTVPVTFMTSTSSGNGVFTATPNPVTLNFTSSLDAAKAQSVTVTGPSAQISTTVTSLGNGPAGWLSVTQPVGPTPGATFQITVTPTNLPTGTTTGSVTVQQTNNSTNFLVIQVSATVGTGSFSFTPNPFNFTAPGGSVTPVNQTLTITGPVNSAVNATASVLTGGTSWLTFNGLTTVSGSLTNGSLQLVVTANAVNLPPNGMFNGSIVITQNNQTVLTIPVTITTTGLPTLTFNPTQLSFAWQIGTNAPTGQTINVTSTANTTVSFIPTASYTSPATCGSNWLVVSPAQATVTSGTTAVPITVNINTIGLPTSTTTCSGNVHIAASGASNPSTDIPVSLLVSVNPLLLVAPTSLTFNSQPGGGTPASQTVAVTSSTPSSALTFTPTVIAATTGGPVFATVTSSQSSNVTPSNLTIGITQSVLATLAPGTYINNLLLTSTTAGNTTTTVPITLVVANTAALTANPGALTLNYQLGTTNFPQTQVITVSSTGAPLTFTATAASANCPNFLTVTQPNGTSTLTASGQNGVGINAAVSTTNLTTPTTCQGTITLTPSNSTAALTIPVTLNVVNTPVINVGANNITATAASGSTAAINVPAIPLTSTDGLRNLSFTITASTNPAGQTWILAFPQTGATPANLNVQLLPAGLATGTYTATITINDTTPNSPVPTQTIPVTFVVAAQATATPSSLTFTAALNGANPGSQTVTIGGVPATTTLAATPSTLSCGTGWLTATVAGNTVTVGITAASLSTTAPATCTGSVAVIVPGAGNSPLNIPVTVTVQSTSLQLSNGSLTFSYSAGSSVIPVAQPVTLTATNNATVSFTATFTPNSASTPGGLVTITPASGSVTGNTGVTLNVGLAPAALANLGPGTYGGVVTVASPGGASVTMNVTVTITQPPPPSVTSIVNSATLQPGPVAPGEIITIFGNNIGPTTPVNLTLTAAGKVATTLGNTQVFFDGTAAPLIYVSSTQINAIVPYEINGRLQTNLTITINGITSPGIILRVTDTSPGIFTLTQNGTGQGAILNQNLTVNGTAAPAPKGSTISIFATGEGVLNPPGSTGGVTTSVPPFPRPVANVQLAFIVPGPGGTTTSVPATLTYMGEAPSLVSGVLQVNAIVPSTVPSGAQTIVLTVGNNSSPSVVTVQVQ